MCDTILAPPSDTELRVMLVGKNSDRQRNEAHVVEYSQGRSYEPSDTVKCTYLEIPQARRTYTTLLSRPFWIWGAEMGANEHGVVIANEGLHAKSPAPQESALTGMDLLRLALERSTSAEDALQIMTSLLKEHGQGGDCGHLTPNFYNNGFLIADRHEAFVLETVEREWVSERIFGVRSLSNIYSIEETADRISAGLPSLLRERGWSLETSPNYAEAITNPHREHIGHAGARRTRSSELLRSHGQSISTSHMMAVLRDHGRLSRSTPTCHPGRNGNVTICMHAGTADRIGQTTASMVSELHQAGALHWVTCTAAPCISIFKPVLLDVPLPQHGPQPDDRFNVHTLWWRHELLHRTAIFGDFEGFLTSILLEREALEARFQSRMAEVLTTEDRAVRSQAVADCWSEAMAMEARWSQTLKKASYSIGDPYINSWLEMNRLSGIDIAMSGNQ
jgi:secernin